MRAPIVLDLDNEHGGLPANSRVRNIPNHVKQNLNEAKRDQTKTTNVQTSVPSGVSSLPSEPSLNRSNCNRNGPGQQSGITLTAEGANGKVSNSNNLGTNGYLSFGSTTYRSSNTTGLGGSSGLLLNPASSSKMTSMPVRDILHTVRQNKPATLSRAPSDDGVSATDGQMATPAIASVVSSNAGVPSLGKVLSNGQVGHAATSTFSNSAGTSFHSMAPSLRNGPTHSTFQAAQSQTYYPGNVRSWQMSKELQANKNKEPKPATLSRAPSDDKVQIKSSQSTRPVSMAAITSTTHGANRYILPKTAANVVPANSGTFSNPQSVLRPPVFNPPGSVAIQGMGGFKQQTGPASVAQTKTSTANLTATQRFPQNSLNQSNSVRTSLNTTATNVQARQVANVTTNALQSNKNPTVAIPQVLDPRRTAIGIPARPPGQATELQVNEMLRKTSEALQKVIDRHHRFRLGTPVRQPAPVPAPAPPPYIPPVPVFQPQPLPQVPIERFGLQPMNHALPRPGPPANYPLPRPGLPLGPQGVPEPVENLDILNDEEQSAIISLQLQEVVR